MNDLFNILIFSKDYNQGAIIQDYIKAIGYNSQVFDQEEAAYEGFLSRNFTLCIINHDIDTKETRTLAAMIKSSENIIPVVFLCEHPTREEIALLFSFHADDVIRKPLDTDILQARIKAVQSRYQPQRKKEVRTYIFGKFKFDLQKQILSIEGKTTKLTTKEADLLTLLCQHANNMVDRMHALQIIWRSDNYFSARSMDVYITKLRKLLQDDPTIKIINDHFDYRIGYDPDGCRNRRRLGNVAFDGYDGCMGTFGVNIDHPDNRTGRIQCICRKRSPAQMPQDRKKWNIF